MFFSAPMEPTPSTQPPPPPPPPPSTLPPPPGGIISEPMKDFVAPASSCTPIDVILDFKSLDQDQSGEITAVEFIDGLRSNRQLAAKFGLTDNILSENGTREKYELTFGNIDYNHTATVNVLAFTLLIPCFILYLF